MTHDIMLPFYGRIDHLQAAVSSVLGQTDPDWRLVVIDDHYPDPAGGEWVAALGDPRIEVLRHAENRGINESFQECVERSRSDWFTIFGCDDLMSPDYLTRVRALAAQHPDATMLHPSVRIIDGDGREVRTLVDSAKAYYRPHGPGVHVLTGEDLAVSVLRGNWMNFPAVAWRGEPTRSVGFRPSLQVVQDLALVLDLCDQGATLVVDNSDPVFSYRRHAGSVSSWRAVDGSRFREERRFFAEQSARFAGRGWPRASKAARVHLSSRVNALTRVPGALRAHDGVGLAELLRHAAGVSAGE